MNISLKIGPVASKSPNDFYLYQNYPNPFNPITTIKYDLPTPTKVSIKIYNILGQEIQTLVNRFEIVGTKSVIWNGKNSTGKSVSSGIYFYQFQAGNIIKNRKMILMK